MKKTSTKILNLLVIVAVALGLTIACVKLQSIGLFIFIIIYGISLIVVKLTRLEKLLERWAIETNEEYE